MNCVFSRLSLLIISKPVGRTSFMLSKTEQTAIDVLGLIRKEVEISQGGLENIRVGTRIGTW